MIQKFYFLIFIIFPLKLFPQQDEVFLFNFHSTPLKSVLIEIAEKFSVEYNYLDSSINDKIIILPRKKYTLTQLHREIEFQAAVQITSIQANLFSISEVEEVTVDQIETLSEVIVQSYLTKGLDKQLGKTVLYPKKFEILPGIAEADALMILQQLPSVISPHETASGLHIRGGKIDQNLILWDGIKIYHQGHLFGMISPFNPEATDKVNFYFKGTHPKFSERISGTIELQTSNQFPHRITLKAGINGLNANIKILTPLISNKLSLELAGRKSFTQWWESPTFCQLAKKVFQNTTYIDYYSENKLGYEDYTTKINFQPRKQTFIQLSNLFIDNVLDFSISLDSLGNKTDQMQIRNNGMSIKWDEKWNEKWNHYFQIYYSNYHFNYKNLKIKDVNFEKFTKYNTIKDYGIDLIFNYLHNEKWNLEMGFQLTNNKVSHAFTIENPNYILDLDHQNSFNRTQSGFFLLKNKLKKWNFHGGLRYSLFQTIGKSSLEPRLIIQNNLTKNWTIQFSFEQKSQLMNQIQESVSSDLSLENYVWSIADGKKFPIIKANQFTSGFTYKNQDWLVNFDLYRKKIKGISSFLYGFFNRFDNDIRTGNGFANGVDILIQKTTPTWNATVTYALLNAENRYENINAYQYFPTNSGIEHAVNINLSKKWNRFSLSAGWNWHTGKPYFTFDADNKIIGFNDKTLPNYHRMDISGMYHFNTSKKWKTSMGFSIFNVYNQKNILSKEYQRRYFSFESTLNNQLQLVEYYSLRITPNLFFKIQF